MNNMSDRLTTLAEVCLKLSYIIFKVVWEKLLRFKGNLLLQFLLKPSKIPSPLFLEYDLNSNMKCLTPTKGAHISNSKLVSPAKKIL